MLKRIFNVFLCKNISEFPKKKYLVFLRMSANTSGFQWPANSHIALDCDQQCAVNGASLSDHGHRVHERQQVGERTVHVGGAKAVAAVAGDAAGVAGVAGDAASVVDVAQVVVG